MGRLDRESQPSGEIGSECIYCRIWWQDPGGRGGAASDWRWPVLGWGRPSLQRSQLLLGLRWQQALASSGSLAPASQLRMGLCPAALWGFLGGQRAQGTVRTMVGFSSFCPMS